MRTLIVGGASSLAHALKPVLAEFSEVITAGRANCDLKLDLRDELEEVVLPSGIDAVINAAADFGGKRIDEMLRAEAVNVLGVLKLCEACSRARVGHFVQISSIFACLERSSPQYGSYALSKKQGDELAQLYCSTSGLALTVLRPSQLYGVGDRYRKHQPFFYNIVDKAANNEDVLIFGSHDARRNFIHVEDVARVVALVIQRKVEGTYACANPVDVTYSEIAEAAIAAFRSRSVVRFVKDKPDIPDNVFPRDESLFERLGYYPQISILVGMQKEALHRKRTG